MTINQLGRYWYGMGKQMMNEKQSTFVCMYVCMYMYVCVCVWLVQHTLLKICKSQGQGIELQSLRGSSPIVKHR